MEPLVAIEFDGGTRYYGRIGIRTPIAYFEPRITAFGGIQREIGLVPGDYRAASCSITLSNADGEFSRLRDAESWRNRPISIFLIDADEGLSSFNIAFVGRIAKWSITKETCTIDAVDAIQQRLTRPIGPVLTPGFFHRLNETTTPHALIPLVIGEVSSPTGAVPAYLVEPSVEITPYRYVAAQGEIKSIDEVFAYGQLVDPGDYTINVIDGPEGPITVIDFDTDQRVAGDTTEPHVSWNGIGQTDDETASGNSINNPAEQLVRALVLNGFDDDPSAGDIDMDTVAAAADTFNQKQITGAFVAVDRDLTIGDVVRQFAESYNIQIFATNGGKVGITAPDPTIDEEAELPEVMALTDVVRDSFSASGPDDVASTLVADYEYNWYSGGFENQLNRRNSLQIGALGENVSLSSEHPFIRDSSSMTAVADIKMFFLREQRQVATALVPPHWHQQLDIGDEIRLTHFAGVGESGYERKIFRVIGIGIQQIGAGTLACNLTLVDLRAEPVFAVPLEDFAQGPIVYSDYFRTPGLGDSLIQGRLRPTG